MEDMPGAGVMEGRVGQSTEVGEVSVGGAGYVEAWGQPRGMGFG